MARKLPVVSGARAQLAPFHEPATDKASQRPSATLPIPLLQVVAADPTKQQVARDFANAVQDEWSRLGVSSGVAEQPNELIPLSGKWLAALGVGQEVLRAVVPTVSVLIDLNLPAGRWARDLRDAGPCDIAVPGCSLEQAYALARGLARRWSLTPEC